MLVLALDLVLGLVLDVLGAGCGLGVGPGAGRCYRFCDTLGPGNRAERNTVGDVSVRLGAGLGTGLGDEPGAILVAALGARVGTGPRVDTVACTTFGVRVVPWCRTWY